jgi:hypothetical protein
VKASKRVLLSAGLGTSIAISGILGIGIIPGAFADETTATPTTSEGGASSVSTADTATTPISPTTTPTTTPTPGTETEAPPDTPATPQPESSAAPSQPTENMDSGQSTNDPQSNVSTYSSPKNITPMENLGSNPVTICHKPGTNAQQTLTVDDNALNGHLGHGDTVGECAAPETVEIFWTLPNGGTPDNVTWPQPYAGTQDQCGVWYQADTYLKSEAENYTADGILTLGEDYQSATQRGAISWRFVYGGDCPLVVVPPKPQVTTDVSQRWVWDCPVQHLWSTVVTHDWTYDVATNTWLANDSSETTMIDTRPLAGCKPFHAGPEPYNPTPTTSTPAPAPVATQDTSKPFHAAPLPVSQQLAQTGSDTTMLYWLGSSLAALLIVLGAAAIISTRRKNG